LLDNGLVPPVGDHEARRVELKRAFSDVTVAVDLDPLSLLCRLAAAVPKSRSHVLRYAGVLAAENELPLVVPPLVAEDKTEAIPREIPVRAISVIRQTGRTHDFQSCTFGHSVTSPRRRAPPGLVHPLRDGRRHPLERDYMRIAP
jgi:hypothetical protein